MTSSHEPRRTGYRLDESPRRVRTLLGGLVVADSRQMRLLYPPSRPPAYYFPEQDVRMDFLTPNGQAEEVADLGPTSFWDVAVAGRTAERAARTFQQPPEALSALSGMVTFDWRAMDAWFEEDEEIFIHPRDPYHRVDVRESSRHLRIEIDGVTVAETRRPRLLFETNTVTRYYIPKLDVRQDLIVPTDTSTGCPYKGLASYWAVNVNGQVHKDVIWSYPSPYEECAKIENLLCFYNERVDLYLDGELQARPPSRAPRPAAAS